MTGRTRRRIVITALALIVPFVLHALTQTFLVQNSAPGWTAGIANVSGVISASVGFAFLAAEFGPRQTAAIAFLYFPVILYLLFFFSIGLAGGI
jgi:hypothetical protein